jgi:replicative DNA helicase
MNSTWEETLLEALLVTDYGHGVDEAIAAGVTSDDFIQSDCRALWRAMTELQARGEPIQTLGLLDEMVSAGVKEADGVATLARTMDGAPVGGRIKYLAGKVRDAANQRRFEKTVELANTRLAEGEDEAWVRNELLDGIANIEANKLEARDYSLAEIQPPTMQAMADRLNGDQAQQGLPTSLADLDLATTGINPEELWVCGGLQGRGKTAFGLQVALHVVGKGFPVYLVSLEMTRAAIFRRLLRIKFGSGVLASPGQRWQEVYDYSEDLRRLPLYIADSASLEASEIAARARMAIQRRGIRLIVIDYLQLIHAEGKDRRESVGNAANILRVLAKDTGVPVLLLSQLRRPLSLDDRPTMIDLKESGDIEGHAHVVLLIYRRYDRQTSAFTCEDEIIIGKQREGPVGSVPVTFLGEHGIFQPRMGEGTDF